MKSRASTKKKKTVKPSLAVVKDGSHAAPSQSAPDSATARQPRFGLEATVERVVPHEWTIQAVDPRLPAVLSTPAMIGVMEFATANAIKPELPAGAISVGTRIEVDHLKAVPDGSLVRAYARLVGYEGRFLVFDTQAWVGEHLIGRGRVFRAIVRPDLHGARAKARISQ